MYEINRKHLRKLQIESRTLMQISNQCESYVNIMERCNESCFCTIRFMTCDNWFIDSTISTCKTHSDYAISLFSQKKAVHVQREKEMIRVRDISHNNTSPWLFVTFGTINPLFRNESHNGYCGHVTCIWHVLLSQFFSTMIQSVWWPRELSTRIHFYVWLCNFLHNSLEISHVLKNCNGWVISFLIWSCIRDYQSEISGGRINCGFFSNSDSYRIRNFIIVQKFCDGFLCFL